MIFVLYSTIFLFLRLETREQENSSHITIETGINGKLLSFCHKNREIFNIT